MECNRTESDIFDGTCESVQMTHQKGIDWEEWFVGDPDLACLDQHLQRGNGAERARRKARRFQSWPPPTPRVLLSRLRCWKNKQNTGLYGLYDDYLVRDRTGQPVIGVSVLRQPVFSPRNGLLWRGKRCTSRRSVSPLLTATLRRETLWRSPETRRTKANAKVWFLCLVFSTKPHLNRERKQ